ncbi:MAG: hypothetical protein M3Y81_09155 [Chloroflexota bacterium]|nr:hypothetical protein [Chloroflexota bacterium]
MQKQTQQPITDVLLITATEVESRAVIKLFEEATGKKFERCFIDGNPYLNLGVINGARIMLVQSEMGAGGPGGSLLVVDEGIRMLSPSAVIMVGLAFGFDDREQNIGDILVSRQLFGYELQKVTTNDKSQRVKFIPRGDRPQAPPRLLGRFRNGVLDWEGPKVAFGLLLSGDKLIDNLDYREQLRAFEPEALGGEMEGIGLYSTAQRRRTDWIVIKAICDWADGNKAQDKNARQQLAAENATRFILHVLKQGGFTEEASNISRPPAPDNTRNPAPRHTQGTLLRRYHEHAGWVLAVAWEPEGSQIASAGADGTVRIWESESGRSLVTYHGHTRLLNQINLQAKIYAAAWSPEGLRIASAGDGSTVYVWNATTGQTLTLYKGHAGSGVAPSVYAVAWSPSGKQIASACSSSGFDKTIHLWDADTGQTLTRYAARYGMLPNFSVLSLAWSPDGIQLAASCGDKTIRVWNTVTGDIAAKYRFRSEWSSSLAWSPDSRYLASTHTDHTVQIWDLFGKTPVKTYHGHTDSVRGVAWSPNGAVIATASNDRTARIWEAATGKHIYTYHGHTDWVTSVTWSNDGTRIASASNDKTVHIWQAESDA